jgi:hypothetical protein
MRRATILTVTIIVACLVGATAADAYTLPRSTARAGAFLSLYDYANSHERAGQGEHTTGVKVDSCARYGPRLFVCLGKWDWELEPGYEYENGATINPCLAKVRVEVRRGKLRRSRPYGVQCIS